MTKKITSHSPRKRFGQHFLQDKNIIEQIIDAMQLIPLQNNYSLVEIGPGKGALTFPLLKKIKKLHAIEIDRDLIRLLQLEAPKYGELILHEADALAFDFKKLAYEKTALRIIGNLPYNISTPLIFHLLSYHRYITDMHFMLQKEVVDRMVAKPNTKDYGRLSVMVQYHCRVNALFLVPPEAFDPPPKVQSAIVRLIPWKTLPYQANSYIDFKNTVKIAFNQRRKMLRKSLKETINIEELEKTGFDLTRRPETLSVAEYVNISKLIINKKT